MILIRSLAFNIAFTLWFLCCTIGGLPLLFTNRENLFPLARLWINGTSFLLRVIVGLKYEVRGIENLPDGACIVASKHQSAWDTLIFMPLLKRPVFIHKKELLWFPFLGLYLWRGGMIAVDRSAGKRAIIHIGRAAKPLLAVGRRIIIFPQGTRTPPGEVRPYRSGVQSIAAATNVPVVPVALNSGLYWGRNAFTKKPGTIILEFLPPIQPPHKDRAAFMAELEGAIEPATLRLEAEGRAKDGV